jgi:diguanylate cyclase (GGDEF)-like protein/PAS domain S-box-containing protein
MFQRCRLSQFSGELADAAQERAFRRAGFRESAAQARLLLQLSIALNTLFLVSDWRFFGDQHFFVAVPARCLVIIASIAVYFGVLRCRRFEALQAWLVGWEWVTALAVGALVSSRSDIALFVVVMLPTIYYLAVPMGFLATAVGGIGCSVILLAGYALPGEPAANLWGLCLAMIMLNTAMLVVLSRANRLHRLEWSAIRSERLARERLAVSQKTLEAVFAALPIPLIVGDLSNGRVLRVNDAARGYFDDAGTGKLADIRMDPGARARFRRLLAQERRVSGLEAGVRAIDGATHDLLLSAAAVEAGGVASVVISGIDISARKAAETRLERLATTDSLTGIANRNHFFARAEGELHRAAHHRRPISALMIDIDHFKRVNDECGHAVGDIALRELARHCVRVLRAEDIIARYGGEEFVVLLPETDGPAARAVAERLREACAEVRLPSALGARRLTVSIGAASTLPGEMQIEPALARADAALYSAKAEGRDRVVLAEAPAAGQAA